MIIFCAMMALTKENNYHLIRKREVNVMSELEKDIRKYLGLPPYNTMTNISYYDGHFLRFLYKKYGELEIRAAEERQNNIEKIENGDKDTQ